MKKYGRKMEFRRIKVKNGVLKVMGMEMGKIGEKEGLNVKNKESYGVKVKNRSKKGRNLVDFGEKLNV